MHILTDNTTKDDKKSEANEQQSGKTSRTEEQKPPPKPAESPDKSNDLFASLMIASILLCFVEPPATTSPTKQPTPDGNKSINQYEHLAFLF